MGPTIHLQPEPQVEIVDVDKRKFDEIAGDDKENAGSNKRRQSGECEHYGNAQPMKMDKTCGQVRQLIRRYLNNSGMKVGDFCQQIGVSHTSYNNFMKETGPKKGMNSDTYLCALTFFQSRERDGIPFPKSKSSASKASGNGQDGKDNNAKDAGGKSSKTENKKAPTAGDLADIHLDGEEKDNVGIYDSCDVARRNLSNFLKRGGATQAQLCRDLGAMYNTKEVKISTTTLSTFRSKKGALAGCTSPAFYAVYVFLEKLRIKENKPKSKHREDMEKIWGKDGGLDIEHDPSKTGMWMHSSERGSIDQYGRLKISKR